MVIHFEEEEKMLEYINIRDPWTLFMLILSFFNLSLTVVYWIYVTYSMSTHSSPLSSLPHILLLGISLGSVASFLSLSLNPISYLFQITSETIFLTYSIIFSSMIVHLIHLRSLSVGVFLPFPYQGLLLLFIFMVQMSLSLQKLILLEIKPSPQTDLMSLLYLTFLLLSVVTLSTTTRNTSTRKEVSYIWLLALSALALWLAWVSIALIFDQFYHKIKSRDNFGGIPW